MANEKTCAACTCHSQPPEFRCSKCREDGCVPTAAAPSPHPVAVEREAVILDLITALAALGLDDEEGEVEALVRGYLVDDSVLPLLAALVGSPEREVDRLVRSTTTPTAAVPEAVDRDDVLDSVLALLNAYGELSTELDALTTLAVWLRGNPAVRVPMSPAAAPPAPTAPAEAVETCPEVFTYADDTTLRCQMPAGHDGDTHGAMNPTCVEQWPDADSGEYNPACCRFPKSCSAWKSWPVAGSDLERRVAELHTAPAPAPVEVDGKDKR